ncbi:hypothetical protein THII_3644 [Thioploca ingrica]|uniref:Uncharacterized protein n=1 Tax=Thioploca ingrica TaxID=40754 RepID=A0A090BW40_9GAMM|nr:hypothetical protein THII_3644 [Thioploca ingrica]
MLVQDTDIRFTLRLLKCCPGFLILLGFILASAAWSATDCTKVTQIPQLECEVLLGLYNSTNGPNWENKSGWNKTNTPCRSTRLS